MRNTDVLLSEGLGAKNTQWIVLLSRSKSPFLHVYRVNGSEPLGTDTLSESLKAEANKAWKVAS